jgi:hypothetical protein
VRVLQACGELDLAAEAVDVEALRQLWGQDLDDDFAAEGLLGGDEHARHSAAAEFAFEHVGVAKGGLELVAEVWGRHGVNVTTLWLCPGARSRSPGWSLVELLFRSTGPGWGTVSLV